MEEVTRISALSNRRPKWQYPQAPTPRILHLPRRQQRKKQPPSQQQQYNKASALKEKKGRLEALFDQERVFAREGGPICEELKVVERRRGRVEEDERRTVVVVEEEKWRFQAEMLRAECSLLRMEREIAVKKLERRKVQMERALKSAVQILLSGQERIRDGKSSGMMMEEDIQELVGKMEKLQRRIRAKDLEVQNCSNFDRQVSLLQRRLYKFGGEFDEISVKEIQEMAEASLSIRANCAVQDSFASNGRCNMEILRREMEKLSRGTLLERIKDEYVSMLSTPNSSAASSASTSKRIDNVDKPPLSASRLCKETGLPDEKRCSGCCRAIVKKVVEQVRVETEQWSQMQEMLGQVRDEMEELQASRKFWEDRALDSDCQVRGLRSSVQEWRRKAVQSESKANELQSQVSLLHKDLERLRRKIGSHSSSAKDPPTQARDLPSEMEKRVLVYTRFKESRCHVKDNSSKQKEVVSKARRKALSSNNAADPTKRSPFVDIGNLSPLRRKNGKASFSNN